MSIEGFIQHRGAAWWGRYNLDQIWAMVAHEDATVTAAQVQSWGRMAELCHDQANALEKAVSQLFHRWPPRPGTAAAAFRDRMLDMIKSMRDSAIHASTMPDPLWKITNQLTAARYDIFELLQQRAATEEIERSQDPTHGYNGKGGGRPQPDALPVNWRDEFDHRAREIMAATEAVIAQAATHLHPPSRYGWPAPIVESRTSIDDGVPNGIPAAFTNTERFDGHAIEDRTGKPGHLGSDFVTGLPRLDQGPVLAGSGVPPLPDTTLAEASFGSPLAAAPYVASAPVGAPPAGGVVGMPIASTRYSATPASATSRPAQSGTHNATQGPMMAPMAGRPGPVTSSLPGGIRASGRRRYRKDGNEPWGGHTGVPAILEPSPEPTGHDPGPGVIGLDR